MAAEFALQYPKRVKKLVLVAPSGVFDPAVQVPDLGAIPPDQLLSYLAHDPKVFEPYLPKSEAEAAAFGERLAGEGQTMARFAPNGPFRPGLEDEGGELKLPVLLLWGRQDRVLPVALSDAWVKALPGIELKLFDNAGHVLLDESAEARQAVVDFLS
jgi:pimeloyl-ACP methyl ester carboxylesterase